MRMLAGKPPLACSAPSECVLGHISATFAGTVAEHVNVTLYCCRDVSRSRRAYCPSKSWLSRSKAKGMNDLRTAKTLIPRKQACSKYAPVNGFICTDIRGLNRVEAEASEKTFFLFEMSMATSEYVGSFQKI